MNKVEELRLFLCEREREKWKLVTFAYFLHSKSSFGLALLYCYYNTRHRKCLTAAGDIHWIVVRAGNIKTFKCWFSENSTTVPSQIIKLKALSQNIKTETACRFLNSDSLTRSLLPLFSFISHFTVGFVEQYRTFRNEISLFFILPIPWNCEPPFFEIFLFLLFSWLPYEYFHFIFIIKQQKKEILQGNEISSFI